MTGIERLRDLYENARLYFELGIGDFTYKGTALASTLKDITDQIEREQEALVREAEDVSGRDSDALAWVEEHGGIGHVRDQWSFLKGRANHADHVDRKLAKRQRQIDESHAALRRRNELLEQYRTANETLLERAAAMKRRLMPEGMEWPRFEDGEPVRIGDEVMVTVHDEGGDFDRTFAIRSIKYEKDGVLLDGTNNEMVILSHGERVTRCRDCAHASPCPLADSEKLMCALHDEMLVSQDDFCSWGEERED